MEEGYCYWCFECGKKLLNESGLSAYYTKEKHNNVFGFIGVITYLFILSFVFEFIYELLGIIIPNRTLIHKLSDPTCIITFAWRILLYIMDIVI